MIDVDKILDMVYWDNPKDVQDKGVELGKNVKHLEAFILPYYEKNSKGVWEGCARILCSKLDEELKPYIRKIFLIIQDLNWPGSLLVFDRLLDFQTGWFDEELELMISYAKKIKDEMWVYSLEDLKRKRKK